MIATEEQQEAVLSDIALKMLTWKAGPVLDAAVAIAQTAISGTAYHFWPDQVDLKRVAKADVKCVGIAYKLLAKACIIEKTCQFRKGKTVSGHGRTVFEYKLVSLGLAKAFVARNRATVSELRTQIDLFTTET